MNYSIGFLLDYRDKCSKLLKKSVDYMDISRIFFYVRMIDILNVLIHKKGYK